MNKLIILNMMTIFLNTAFASNQSNPADLEDNPILKEMYGTEEQYTPLDHHLLTLLGAKSYFSYESSEDETDSEDETNSDSE